MTRRIAIFADVHGNIPALSAVLKDLELIQPDEILVGGDLVGRGPQGGAVIDEIRSRRWPSVRGNHEEYLTSFRRREVPSHWLTSDDWDASRWMAAELTEEHEHYIASLPFSLNAGGGEIFLTHGSPVSTNDGLGPWSRDRKLEKALSMIDGELLVCAHTHRPMLRKVGAGMVVNIGSVGLPFNGDRRAQYALFHSRTSDWDVEFRQVEYNLEETLEIYRESGFLQTGGVTSDLLRLELLHAAPFLVPFQKWADVVGARHDLEHVEEFLSFYDAQEPMRDFFLRLGSLAAGSRR